MAAIIEKEDLHVLRENNSLITFAHQVSFIITFVEHIIIGVFLINDHEMKEHPCQI